jgi:hypothetical protein
MRVGLTGYCDDSWVGKVTTDLWGRLPFCSWLVPRSPRCGVEVPEAVTRDTAGRKLYLMGGCHKFSRQFLDGLDAVLAVGHTVPRQLFYYATDLHKPAIRTVLLASPEGPDDRNAYWYKHADVVLANQGRCRELADALGRTVFNVPVPLDEESMADLLAEKIWWFLENR